jgi:hypothetical protein
VIYGSGSNWYDAVYGNDPSTDNIFGREALAPRREPLLHAYLSRGGRLGDFARHKAQTRQTAILDRALPGNSD